MKKAIIITLTAALVHTSGLAQVGISATSVVPNPSAMLDVSSTTKGLLAPRMTEAQKLAIPAPANGLMVFQSNLAVGFWYYDALAAAWVQLFNGPDPWTVFGNPGTNPATQFLGTVNAQPLIFSTNNVERARLVQTTLRVGVGTTTPNELVEINGALKVNGTSATNDAGNMRWNATTSAHEGNVDGTAAGWYQLENIFTEEVSQPYQQIVSSCAPNTVTIGTGATTTSGTIETPYGTLWEDHRVQYLYRAADLAAVNLCPNENITALAFNATSAGSYAMNNVEIKMKNTTLTALTDFDYTGLQLVWSGTNHTPVNTWNTYTFSSPFQWNGTANVIVEYCYDNNDWQNNVTVRADATSYSALYGLYCDACAGTGAVPCGTPPIVGNGAKGGCQLTSTDNLTTCDGSFQWNGSKGNANKRAQIRFTGQTGASVINILNADYIWYSNAVMIGTPAWATAGGPPFSFKGPGTISAQNAVWGGGVLLNDHVYDIYFDGRPRTADAERTANYKRCTIDEMVNYVEKERHLPTMDGREAWATTGKFSLDHLTNQLWVTMEEQSLYIKELNERMDLLQQILIEQKLK